MELLLLALGVFSVAAIGGAISGLFDKNERIRRLMRGARTVKIREAHDGQVAKIAGRARPAGEALTAPLSGRRCVYFAIEVTEWEGTQPRRITRSHEQRDFLIDDGTGRAVVRVQRAQIAVAEPRRWPSHDPSDPRLKASLEALSISWKPGKQITFAEAVIEVDADVAASGRCAWEADPDPDPFAGSYREMPRRLSLAAGPGEVVVISSGR